MMVRTRRRVMLVCGAGALVLSMAAASHACWPFDGLFGCSRTTYSPPMPVACAPCAPQVCAYTPQTYFRTYYRPVPVLSYRPVSACDPCSGCAITAYRPTRSWAYQACLVPYTTYRVVYSDPCAPACAPCGTSCGPCGVGSATFGVPSSGCSSCSAPAASASLTPIPATSIPGPNSMSLPPALPSASSGPTLGAPTTVTPAPGSGTTFAPNGTNSSPPSTGTPAGNAPATGGASGPQSGGALRPIPQPQSYQRPAAPGTPAREAGPPWNIRVPTQPVETPNKTASRPVYQAAHYQRISAQQAKSPAYNPEGLDDSGWRPARD